MADFEAQLQSGLSGRYVIDRKLGRGGMATVFLGHDLKHDRPIALKVSTLTRCWSSGHYSELCH